MGRILRSNSRSKQAIPNGIDYTSFFCVCVCYRWWTASILLSPLSGLLQQLAKQTSALRIFNWSSAPIAMCILWKTGIGIVRIDPSRGVFPAISKILYVVVPSFNIISVRWSLRIIKEVWSFYSHLFIYINMKSLMSRFTKKKSLGLMFVTFAKIETNDYSFKMYRNDPYAGKRSLLSASQWCALL